MEDTLRAALYARVSSQRQADEVTIASQLAAIESRFQEDGVTIDPELYFIDDGCSGTVLVRPALERLRDLAWCGGLDRLCVYDPDRLARKYVYQMLLLEEFNQYGVEVIFLNHDVQHQTPEGNLLLQVQGMIAEYERIKILERTRRGRRFAARQGKISALGGAPYGYHYVSKQQGGGEARYEIIDEEARVIREMFSWVGVEGLTLSKVAQRLTDANVPTRMGYDRWDRSTIRGMLSNPAYMGTAKFGKIRVLPGQTDVQANRENASQPRRKATQEHEQERIVVPALVSESLFAAVAEQLEANRRRQREQKEGAEHLLSGLLVCGICNSAYCGRRMRRKTSDVPYVYYRCIGTDKYRYGGEAICSNNSLRGPELEESIWSDVCSLLQDSGRLHREFERRLERVPEVSAEDLSLQKSIARLKQRIARLLDAYEGGWVDKADFESRMSRAKARLSSEEAALQEQQRLSRQEEELRLFVGHFETFAEQMREGLDGADLATRRKLLQLLIDRIEVGKDELRIVYKVQPHPFVSSPVSRGVLHDCLELVSAPSGRTKAGKPAP